MPIKNWVPIKVEFKHNNAGVRDTCGITGNSFKPAIGIWPFLAGTWRAIDWDFFADWDAAGAGESVIDDEAMIAIPLDSAKVRRRHIVPLAGQHVEVWDVEASLIREIIPETALSAGGSSESTASAARILVQKVSEDSANGGTFYRGVLDDVLYVCKGVDGAQTWFVCSEAGEQICDAGSGVRFEIVGGSDAGDCEVRRC